VEGTADVNPEQMFDRILNALVPHPDSVIATELAGESVTVLANGVEELEND
jgi:hypothetical protein